LDELERPDFENLIKERFRDYQMSSKEARTLVPRRFYSPEVKPPRVTMKAEAKHSPEVKRSHVPMKAVAKRSHPQKAKDPTKPWFRPGDKVQAVYNSWIGEKKKYPAFVKQTWWDNKSKIYRYDVVYEEDYEGELVTEYGLETRLLQLDEK
jgi:hypothetical protein